MADALPPLARGLTRRRKVAGAAAFAVVLPAVVAVLVQHRTELSYATPVLVVLSLVIAVALIGGLTVALPAAVAGGLALNWFLTPPYGTLAVDRGDQVVV